MRVFIGPYNHWFQPAHWLEGWVLWAYGFNYRVDWDEIVAKRPNALAEIDAIKERLHDKWYYNWLYAAENWVDNKYKRKIVVRIDPCDTWSADHTLSVIAVPLLKALRDKKPGAPHVDDADVPEELRSTAASPLTEEQAQWGTPDDNWHPRWRWVLDEVIWALEQVANDDSDDQFFTHHDEPESPGSVFNKCDIDREGYDKWQARKQNGLLLFGKYYEALWD
jgi:hypothetical protein